MRITKEQQYALSSLRCERLSSNEANFRLIEDFYNTKNSNIVDALQNDAYREDMDGELAYYLVKDKDDDILFFFSLKCGVLYDEFLEGEKLRNLNLFYEYILKMSVDDNVNEEEKLLLGSLLEKTRSKRGLKKVDIARILHKSKEVEAVERMSDGNVKNVGKTYSGIELVHFCANDGKRDKWVEYGITQKLGTVVFWHLVVPIVQDAMRLVGCEYLYLFAADMTEDEELVNYYKTNLNFHDSDDHNTAIPLYDFACKFMCQETKGLNEARERFYNYFNNDKGYVLFPGQQ